MNLHVRRKVVQYLLESGETPPAVFVLHPQRESPAQEQEDQRSDGTPLSPAQIHEHARRLATDHQLDSKRLRNIELLRRLEKARAGSGAGLAGAHIPDIPE